MTETHHFHGPTTGWGLWRRAWLSRCSRHQAPDGHCVRCMRGRYHWGLALQLSALVFRCAPRLWRWWVNRPGSRQRRALEQHFPNLHGKLTKRFMLTHAQLRQMTLSPDKED